MLKTLSLFFFSYALIACSPASNSQLPIKPIRNVSELQDLVNDVNKPFILFPTPDNYSICHGHTCNQFAFISLSKEQWQTVKTLFLPTAQNSEQERHQIKLAIALLEKLTGEQAGTNKDKAKNYVSNGLNGQLDCIDEATNTSVYLRMLHNAGLITFHQQASRTSRGGLITPHNTATIIEIASSTRYAVDSWFGDNGQAPAIIPLTQWKKGWKPDPK